MRNRKRGSAFIYVIVLSGVIAVGAIYGLRLIGSIAHSTKENRNRSAMTLERGVMGDACAAYVRKALRSNNPDVFAELTRENLQQFASRDPRVGTSQGVGVVSVAAPATPRFFSQLPIEPTNAIAAHPLGASAVVENAFSVPIALESTAFSQKHGMTESWNGSVSEYPTSEACFIAAAPFDATNTPYPIVSDLAIFPHGVVGGAGPGFQCADIISNAQWTNGPAITATRSHINPGLECSWLVPASDLTSAQPTATFAYQSLRGLAQVVQFNGRSIGASPTGAIYTAFANGAPRVVVDVSALPSTNVVIDPSGDMLDPNNFASIYYVDCTSALARARGIVIVGAGSANRRGDIILTNGSIELRGEQTGGPLMVGSSYGAVTFSASLPARDWRLFLCTPTAPPAETASVVVPTSVIELTDEDVASDSLQIHVGVTGGGWSVGLAASVGVQPQLVVRESAGIVSLVAEDKLGVQNVLTSLPSSGADQITLIYSRAIGRFTLKTSLGSAEADLPIGTFPAYYHTAAIVPTGAISVIQTVARPLGTAFYGRGLETTPIIRGGLLVGSRVSGDLSALTVRKESLAGLFHIMPRFIYFAP